MPNELTLLPLFAAFAILLFGGCDLDSKSIGDPQMEVSDSGDPIDDPIAACIASNLPEDGHGWESDTDDMCPQAPGSPPVECPPATERTEQACVAEGITCDHETLITRDAALCIASELGLAPGMGDWFAHLVYNYGVRRPVWAVQNTTSQSGCTSQGEGVRVDAETGEPLEDYDWLGTC